MYRILFKLLLARVTTVKNDSLPDYACELTIGDRRFETFSLSIQLQVNTSAQPIRTPPSSPPLETQAANMYFVPEYTKCI
jgi:hypothetical protein